MSNEIEEFLRRAAERRRRQMQQQQAPQQPPQHQPPQRPAPQQQMPQRPAPQEIQYLQPEIVDAEIIEADPFPSHENVAQHVTRHMDMREFTERASHLGEEVGLADDNLEARLHSTFDHDLGKLAKGDTATDDFHQSQSQAAKTAARSAAANLAAMLTQPQNLRQAIILSEILGRPEDRW